MTSALSCSPDATGGGRSAPVSTQASRLRQAEESWDGESLDASNPGWSSTGSMASPRGEGHTLTLLPSGKVLTTGGHTGRSVTSGAELYDPTTGTWSSAGNMASSRQFHAATLLPSGQLLVTGGFTDSYSWLRSAELYDPTTGTWSVTTNMPEPRQYHAAILLPSGKVLVLGGATTNAVTLRTVVEYDPATAQWSSRGLLSYARMGHTATLLPSGKVLVVGGGTTSGTTGLSSELFDPATGTSSPAGAGSPYGHTATLLKSGKVLIAGDRFSTNARVYDPVTRTTSPIPMPDTHYFHAAAILPSGRVLVTGGALDTGGASPAADLYDPLTHTWKSQAYMPAVRSRHQAVGLPSGHVLVVGGYNSNLFSQATSFLFDSGERAPVAQALSVTTAEDTPVAVTLQATDVNKDPLTYEVLSSPAHGSLTGTAPHLTYVPARDFAGQDSFTWRASDGTAHSASTPVSLTVTPVNDAPVASAFSLNVAQDSSIPVTLSGVDPENGTLSYSLVSWPLNGWLSGTPPHLIYTPVRGFSGSDSFDYQVSDGKLSSALVTIPITVTMGGAEEFLRLEGNTALSVDPGFHSR